MSIHPLANQLEYHEESSNAQAAKNIGGEFVERSDVMLIYSHLEFGGGLNFACRVRTDAARVESLIDEVCEWFASRQIDSPLVRVSPLTRPVNLAQILEQRGFVCVEHETQMVLENSDTEPATNSRVTIEKIQAQDLERWVGIQHHGFGGTGEPSTTMIEMARKSFESGMSTPYWARIDGEPVGAGSLIHWAGAYGIYGVAVAEQARRHGIGTAMVRQMIRDVRSHSDEPLCLQAETNSATQHWYERLGFRVVYDRTGWTKQ